MVLMTQWGDESVNRSKDKDMAKINKFQLKQTNGLKSQNLVLWKHTNGLKTDMYK